MLTARWLFAVMSKSPHIRNLSAVTAAQTEEINRTFARLVTRLVTKDCADEVRPIVANNFVAGFQLVGRSLGETAMTELMSGKEVDKAVGAYTDYLSENDFKVLVDSLPKASEASSK